MVSGGKPGQRLRVPVVFINPFDSYSFHDVPARRRAWFDRHISMLDPGYSRSLAKYGRLLRQRNALLGEGGGGALRGQVVAIDREMAAHAKGLTNGREVFLAEIEPLCGAAFEQLFSESHSIKPQLISRAQGMDEENLFDMMQKRLPKDLAAGITTYGVHRDDYSFLLDGLDAFDYSSLGQQKMGYLSLLFAYIGFFRYKLKAFPIVLIDDVSGELDRLRWRRLVEYLERSEFQVLITTANERFKEELESIVGVNKLLVRSGSVGRVC